MPLDPIERMWNEVVSLQNEGRTQEAVDCCARLLTTCPDHPEALHFLGCVHLAVGDAAGARAYLEREAALNPGSANAHEALGAAFMALGEHGLAIEAFRRLTGCLLSSERGHYRLGAALRAAGRHEEAVASFREAIRIRPDLPEAHNELGLALASLGRNEEAVPSFRRAVQLRDDYVAALCNLACALHASGRNGEAKECCRQAIQRSPDSSDGYRILGGLLAEEEAFDEAVPVFERAYEIDGDPNVAYNLGIALTKLDRSSDAAAYLQQAVEADPSNRFARSWLWTALFAVGDWERAFKVYDRWSEMYMLPLRGFDRPRWRGEPMPGGILLAYSQLGFGDAIQALRFLPVAAERSQATIVYEGKPELVPLVANVPCVRSAVACAPELTPPAVEFDAVIDLMSVGAMGCSDPAMLPQPPYLTPSTDRAAAWRERLSGRRGLRIGLCWSGDSTSPWEDKRSCRLADLVEAVRRPGVDLFSLQVGSGGTRQLGELPDGVVIEHLGADFRDFNETAAAMMNLDLIVSVDTATAHLAGALARPCWTLLCRSPDGRWMERRDDCPWYPTMRLFRQSAPGDWASVFRMVSMELDALIESGSGRAP
jgi:tetratricopeptide (TPR) repeat protein